MKSKNINKRRMKFIEMALKFFSIISLLAIYIYGKIYKQKLISVSNYYEKENTILMRETASECTLFLNKNDEFPLNKLCKIFLIGSGARNTIKGSLGSGDVESKTFMTIEKGLENAGFTITSKEWLNQYPILKEQKIKEHLNYIEDLYTTYKGQGFAMVSFPEYDYELNIKEEEKSDVAIYVLARNSGEGMDRRLIKGDALLTDTEVKDILYLNENYKKFMLVLNVGGVVDLTPVKNVSNILLLSQLGVVTGDIFGDIILGQENPSGKLAATWASVNDSKFMKEFGSLDDTNYIEGVYVGYRYFNSAGVKPLYPFGFGLSYSCFEISKKSLKNEKDEITIEVKVKNLGKLPGKEVVQVYISPSQENVDKPYQSLVAFKKTPKIEESKEVELTLSFNLTSVARYDEKNSSYILDKGKYIIRVGNSSENTAIFGYIELDEDIITEKLKNINSNIDFEDYKPEIIIKDDLKDIQKIKLSKDDFILKEVKYEYEPKTNPFISNLENKELAKLCIGNYKERYTNGSFGREVGWAGSTTTYVKGINNFLAMADGPAGLRLTKIYCRDYRGYHRLSKDPLISNSFKYLQTEENISLNNTNNDEIDLSEYSNIVYQYTTAIPIGTALAQTFNEELIEKYGDAIGKEMESFNIHLWLAPGMNIQRNILCGRNFEYFSEDPLVTGKMAAALTRGVQSHKNRGTTVKHFAANNQEFNRLGHNAKMSERALREIYLKGFKIAIEESQPHALMTSYNLINGIHTSQNPQLLINVLRNEWNYTGLIMTDWSHSYRNEYEASKYSPQTSFEIIKAGNNIMMPGGDNDYDLLLEKLKDETITRDDLLACASKVYEIIELLNK